MKLAETKNRGFISITNPGSPWNYTEAYKSLRTNLNFVSLNKKYKKILVTSSIPKEGKTGFALNLSASLSEAGNRVLLVDCDLRKPTLYKYMQIQHGRGLTNLFTGESLDYLIQKIPGFRIDFLDSGITPPNPVEILGSPLIKKMFDSLEARYDYIIVDTPPVGVVTDAAVLSTIVDGVIFVIRQKFAAIEQIKLGKANLEAVHADIIGAVLNDFDASSANKKGGYYYNYSYQNDYSKHANS